MFKLFAPKGDKLNLKIIGMHCTSCSMSIDNTLEDVSGVLSSKTNYAKSMSYITYDSNIVAPNEIIASVKKLGYDAMII